MKRVAFVIIVSTLLVSIFAYTTHAKAADELRVPIGNSNILISPAGVKDQSSTFVLYQIYDGLVGFNERLEVVPRLAKNWTVSMDGLRYHFVVDRTLQYASGKYVSGQLIARYYEWLIKNHPEKRWIFDSIKGVNSYVSGSASNISGMTATDDSISFELIRPSHIFLINLASTLALVGFTDSEAAIFYGTGPYRFHSRDSNSINLERNPINHRGKHAQIEKIIFISGVPVESQRQMFESGKIDVFQLFDREAQDSQLSYNSYEFQSYAMGLLLLNYHSLNRRTRVATCLALDKNELAQKSNLINAQATDSIIPNDFGVVGSKIQCDRHVQSMVRVNKRIRFLTSERYYLSSSEMFDEIKKVFLKLGVTVEFNAEPHSTYISKLYKRDFDVAFVSYLGDYPDADAYYYPFLISNGEFNFMGYSNKIVDELLNMSREMLSADDRYRIYKKISEILSQDPTVIPLFSSVGRLITRPHIHLSSISGRGIFSVDISQVRVNENLWSLVRGKNVQNQIH